MHSQCHQCDQAALSLAIYSGLRMVYIIITTAYSEKCLEGTVGLQLTNDHRCGQENTASLNV